jgi:hypothetical protein
MDPPAGESRASFVSWSNGQPREHRITVSATVTMLTANFRVSHAITAISSDPVAGEVSISPDSPDGFYDTGAAVTIRALPAAGYCFTGWTGLVGGPDRQVLVDRPLAVSAGFRRGAFTLSSYSVLAPAGGGTFEVGVSANDGCVWTASAEAPWVHLATERNIVAITVDAADQPRQAYVQIAGQLVSVKQGY